MFNLYSRQWFKTNFVFSLIMFRSRIFYVALNFYSQLPCILDSSMLMMTKASGKIPAFCMARAWALVLGNPERMKLFFSF